MTRSRSNRAPWLTPFAIVSFLLACFAAAGCAGDDTNPPAPPSDAGTDAPAEAGVKTDGSIGSTDANPASATDAAGEASEATD